MGKAFLFIILTVTALALVSAWGEARAPVPGEGQRPAAQRTSPAPASGWEAKWQSTLGEARKEGVVSLYVSAIWGSGLRASLTQAFRDKYGINLEFSPMSGTQIAVKVGAEQGAGLFLADVFGSGNSTVFTTMKPNHLVGPIDRILVLPEVLDPKAWDGGDLFYYPTEDKYWVDMLRVAARTVINNTTLVKESDLSSYRDLLKPQFKGQLALLDPRDGGAGTPPVHTAAWGET